MTEREGQQGPFLNGEDDEVAGESSVVIDISKMSAEEFSSYLAALPRPRNGNNGSSRGTQASLHT